MIYLKIASILNLITALIHLISGQIDLMLPLLGSNLPVQQKGELFGVWHIVSILLFYTSVILLRHSFGKKKSKSLGALRFIGKLYVFASVPFMLSSLYFSILAPQWILLLPIGLLVWVGVIKNQPLSE